MSKRKTKSERFRYRSEIAYTEEELDKACNRVAREMLEKVKAAHDDPRNGNCGDLGQNARARMLAEIDRLLEEVADG